MRRSVLILLLISLSLSACTSVVRPPVITESRGGDPLVQVEIPAAGPRSEIPAGVDADNVVSIIHTDSDSVIVIAENTDRTIKEKVLGKRKYTAYLDNKAVAEEKIVKAKGGELIAQPKAPWWKWPLYIFLGMIALATLYFIRPIIELIKTSIELLTRFRK